MGYRLSDEGYKRVDLARKAKGWNKGEKEWYEKALVALPTLRKFWARKTIGRESFENICDVLGVDWRGVVERPPDPSFTGREEAMKTLTAFVSQGYRLILIQGEGGIGKTTVAEKFLQPPFCNLILKLDILTEPISVQELVKEWLKKDFEVEPSEDFGINLNRLRSQLKKSKVGILIDGLEGILQRGQVFPELQHYIELLKMLSDRDLKSLTLITSREPLNEPSLKNLALHKLSPLSLNTWEYFFSHHQITIESITATIALEKIHYAYGGNAQAMKLILDVIKTESDGNIESWWQHKQTNLFCNHTLNTLVKCQLEKLANDSPLAYQLLCRMGVYRYPVPEDGLWKLLWDIDPMHHREVVGVLKDCSLVQMQNYKYSLHPMVQLQAIELLQSKRGYVHQKENLLVRALLQQGLQHQPLPEFPPNLDLLLTTRSKLTLWYLANWAAGEFYLQYCEREDESPVAVNYAFEAIKHFEVIADFKKCYHILYFNILKAENIENLRCTPHLWNHMDRLRDMIEMLQNKVSAKQAALIKIPLAIIYAEGGQARKAIKISREIIAQIEAEDKFNEQSYFIRLSAYSVIGKCYRYMGNFQEAELACKAANKIAAVSGKMYWQAIALYGFGALYLEFNLVHKALYCFIQASAYAWWKHTNKSIQLIQWKRRTLDKVADLLSQPLDAQIAKISVRIEGADRLGDRAHRIKEFNILWNVARCLNQMKNYPIAKKVLDIAAKFIDADDRNQNCLLALEQATYFTSQKQSERVEENYHLALGYASHPSQAWCQVSALKYYADWLYQTHNFNGALEQYQTLYERLIDTDFDGIRAHALDCLESLASRGRE